MLKFRLFMLGCVIAGALFGVAWHMRDAFPPAYGTTPPGAEDPLDCAWHSALFPDTLCMLSGWSPGFSGFGITEGMVYVALKKTDLFIQTQYHPLMVNSSAALGFSILNETNIKAGIRIHYAASSIPGVETLHAGSCSGGLMIYPDSGWVLGLEMRHLVDIPQDTSYRIFESFNTAGLSYRICQQLMVSTGLQKQAAYPWQLFMSCFYTPWPFIRASVSYTIPEKAVFVGLRLNSGRWGVHIIFRHHELLGLSETLALSYAY